MHGEKTDPSVIRSLAVTAEDLVAAVESRHQRGVRVVLRVTPPFSGRMRARIHVPTGDDDGSVHEDDIEAIAAAGITHGCNPPDNDRFCPDATVTRAQMAAFLRRGFDLPAGPAAFVDDDGHVLEGDIDALAASGITRGCNPPDNADALRARIGRRAGRAWRA
jgi:hypothetical protein